jgi:SAM-dependent methyltransferase
MNGIGHAGLLARLFETIAAVMRGLTEWTMRRFWAGVPHPYAILRARLAALVKPGITVIDAGCGYTAPTLRELAGNGARLIGVDLVPIESHPGLELIEADLARIPLPDGTADLLYSRSVMEHVTDPDSVYAETRRLLKPGGRWLFLTANRWDYVSLAARAIPNRFHGRIVAALEGRREADVFPTAYLTNDRTQIEALAARHGFAMERFDRLTQYPSMFGGFGPAFRLATLYERLITRVDALAGLRGWLLVEMVRR